MLGVSLFQGCQTDDMTEQSGFDETELTLKKADKDLIFYGAAVPVGQGVARTWIREDSAGEPVEAGITLSAGALNNLPHHHQAYVLPFHVKKGKHVYDHVLLDWGPEGHEPPGVYDIPHFDIHFYITSVSEREAIGYQEDDLDPDPQYIPPFYIRLPGVVPQMGSHWVNVTSPELAPVDPAVFTHTLILGSFDGWFTFWEPMITRDFLLSKTHVEASIPQPSAWQQDGYYPTGYSISYSDRPAQYHISLTGLTWRMGE